MRTGRVVSGGLCALSTATSAHSPAKTRSPVCTASGDEKPSAHSPAKTRSAVRTAGPYGNDAGRRRSQTARTRLDRVPNGDRVGRRPPSWFRNCRHRATASASPELNQPKTASMVPLLQTLLPCTCRTGKVHRPPSASPSPPHMKPTHARRRESPCVHISRFAAGASRSVALLHLVEPLVGQHHGLGDVLEGIGPDGHHDPAVRNGQIERI